MQWPMAIKDLGSYDDADADARALQIEVTVLL